MPTQEENTRTVKQNKAMHLYFTHLAETLNDAGLDMKAVLKPEIEIPWTKQSVKEFIWKPILKKYSGKDSTAQMTTGEIDKIFDIINRHLSEKFGLTVEFPSLESEAFTNLVIRK